jgi:hypothetical protein
MARKFYYVLFMTAIQMYRDNAAARRPPPAAQRAAADATNLPNRREMHERSALVWDLMAEAVEDTVAKAAVNLAAKRVR